jgi:hypothetical protein
VVQTSWLLTITLGAEAVLGVLSTVVVPVTVLDTVLVSAFTSVIVAVTPNKNKIVNNNFTYAPQESQPSLHTQGSHPHAIQGSVIMLYNFYLQ